MIASMEDSTHALPPCRLKFAFSSNGKRCVILRRGPSDWVRMILWDMVTNEFSLGQWLHGPIRDFDISPQGDHVIYFVSYHKKRSPYLWVAISKPPYFSALAMWPISDAWGGTCAFIDEEKISINKGMYQSSLDLAPNFQLEKYSIVELDSLEEWKAKRRGWHKQTPSDGSDSRVRNNPEFRKKSPKDELTLCSRRSRNYHSTPRYRYWLLNTDGKTIELGAEFADFDPSGRLIFSNKGRLCVGNIDESGQLVTNEIADFNNQVPEEIEAPLSARTW